jgi:hypothetical protein
MSGFVLAGSRAEVPVIGRGRYAPPVHMIKLTVTQEIMRAYKWVHPDEER